MLTFLAEIVGEMLGPWILALAYWLAHTVVWLALYPWLLLVGWGRLWLRERGRRGWLAHGPQGLHRVGQWQATLAVQYLAAVLLILLAVVGVGGVFYGIIQHANL